MTSRMPALIVHGGAGADPTEEPDEPARASRPPSKPAGESSAAEAARSTRWRRPCAPRRPSAFQCRPRLRAHDRGHRGDGRVHHGGRHPRQRRGGLRLRGPEPDHPRPAHPGRRAPSFFVGTGAIDQARALGVPLCDPRQPSPRGSNSGSRRSGGHRGRRRHRSFRHHRRRHVHRRPGGPAPGRVGDTPLIGCGTYAESKLGGVSCTGDGEATIRVVLARRALEILRTVEDPEQAAQVAISVLWRKGTATADSS